MARIIHQKLGQKHGLITTHVPYWRYEPASVHENELARLYWDRPVITDRTIRSNRPDIILTLKKEKITFLIDVAIPSSHNVQDTVAEKINKYTELAIEVKRIWKQEVVRIVPLVISATAIIPLSLRQAILEIGLPQEIQGLLQKSVVLSTCNMVRKHLGL